jgi:hypothetical protein
MPGTPVGIPIDFQGRVRIVRLNLGKRPTRAVKTKEGNVVVKIVTLGDMFSLVGRWRILAGFSNLHIHVVEKVEFPGGLRQERFNALNVLDGEMFTRLEVRLGIAILLKPFAYGFVAAVRFGKNR